MVLPIIKYGNAILRKKGTPIEKITSDIRILAQNMIDTMNHTCGIGLAAQQVGYAVQLCVLNVPFLENRPSRLWIKGAEVALEDYMPMVLLNPELQLAKQRYVDLEGCLSFPEISADISRPLRAKVKAQDLKGNWIEWEGEGLIARAIQHEIDHLNGVLFIDRMDSATRSSLQNTLKFLLQSSQSSE